MAMSVTDCLFCKIIAGDIPSRKIWESDQAYAFLDISPWHRGHSLIIPKNHIVDGTSDPEAWSAVGQGITTVTSLLAERLKATGFNILSNAGADSGQEVFHFHVHVIPRYPNQPGMAGLMERDPKAADDLDGLAAWLTQTS
jgi:histidine triad (HIT) family protein